jgi:hypothetical protein
MSPAPCSGSPSQASGRPAAHNYRIRHPPSERHAGCQPAIRPNAIWRYENGAPPKWPFYTNVSGRRVGMGPKEAGFFSHEGGFTHGK